MYEPLLTREAKTQIKHLKSTVESSEDGLQIKQKICSEVFF
jgi:hypothetical protein